MRLESEQSEESTVPVVPANLPEPAVSDTNHATRPASDMNDAALPSSDTIHATRQSSGMTSPPSPLTKTGSMR